MGAELPDAARLRMVTESRLHKLIASVQQPASPAASPTRSRATALSHCSGSNRNEKAAIILDTWQPTAAPSQGMVVAESGADGGATGLVFNGAHIALAPQPNIAAAHQSSSSLGGSSDQASPRFLDMLRASLPREEEGESSSASTSGLPDGKQRTSSELPSMLAALHALNGHAAAARVASLQNGSPAAAPGKKSKRGFLGLFHRSSKHGKEKEPGHAQLGASAPVAAEASNGGSKKKGSNNWFGSSKSNDASPAAVASASVPRPPLCPQLPASKAAEQEEPRGVLLPGLPLQMSRNSDAGSSGVNDAASQAGGSLHVAAASEGGAATITDASDLSMPSSAQPSPVVGPLGLPSSVDVPEGKKDAPRRHRSLTSMLMPGWRRRSHPSAGSESELAGDVTPTRGASHTHTRAASPTPKSAEALAVAKAAGAYSCFGVGTTSSPDGELVYRAPSVVEKPRPPLLPPGTTGLRNVGNTCFVNAALQCLRYTPGLPLHVAPDLLERVQQQGQPARQPAGGAAGDVAEPEPAAGEEVHEQALARASMDMWASAALAVANTLAEEKDDKVEEEEGEAVPVGAAAAAGSDGALAAEPAADDFEAPAAEGGEAADDNAPATAGPEAGSAAEEATAEETPVGKATADKSSDAADGVTQQQQQLVQVMQPPQQLGQLRPPRGALLKAFADLVAELYLPPSNGGAVCATPLLRTLRAFPIAADYFDGGQHDCQEVLRVVMDLLHEDLNRVPPRPLSAAAQSSSAETAAGQDGQPSEQGNARSPAGPQQQEKEEQQPSNAAAAPAADAEQQGEQLPALAPEGPLQPAQEQEQGQREGEGQQGKQPEDEGVKADRLWQQYHERDSSSITDLFGGQLQSSVTCHKCSGRFTMYEPFWDLSLPLAKEAKGGSFSWLGLKGSSPASIQDCLTAFTADETMEGAEAFHCERCNEKTAATKHLRVHRFPEVLVLHIKRFKYKGASTDKLSANVSFPLTGLALHQFASPECPAGPNECSYNLFAVSNHYGNLSGGHYTAMCRVPQASGEDAWYSFNDEQVTRVSPNQVVSQYAYILFYVRSLASTAAHHRRNHSAASAGTAAGQ